MAKQTVRYADTQRHRLRSRQAESEGEIVSTEVYLSGIPVEGHVLVVLGRGA